jgi:hypothetical protein
MREEALKVLEMLAEGATNPEQAMELLEAMGAFEPTPTRTQPQPDLFDYVNKTVGAAKHVAESAASKIWSTLNVNRPSEPKPKMLDIQYESCEGDEIKLKIPEGTARGGLDIRKLTVSNINLDDDWAERISESIKIALEMMDSGAAGELISIESARGDSFTISIK